MDNSTPGPGRPPAKRGRGRPKGRVNKKLSDSLIERIHEKYPDFCPVLEMIDTAMDPNNTPDLRFNACKEVAQYIYPKKKAVEVNSREGGTFQVVLKQYNNASNDEQIEDEPGDTE